MGAFSGPAINRYTFDLQIKMCAKLAKFSKPFWKLSSPLFLLGIFSPTEVQSAKILSVSFFSTKSHKIDYEKLLHALAQRGHQVTYIGPIPGTKNVTNLKEFPNVDFKDLAKRLLARANAFETRKSMNSELLTVLFNLSTSASTD